jgi:hypothetical protein
MPTQQILIDYENVQPKNLTELAGHPVHVLVFVGANQTKIPFDLAEGLQSLGERAEYKKISGTGRNALDFHIAYYLGELVKADPKSSFHIISRDTGFDPLVRHLNERGITALRSRDLAELPFLQIAVDRPEREQFDEIVRKLSGLGQARPRKVKTLANTINAFFNKNMTDSQLEPIIEQLRQSGYIKVDGGNVAYSLPGKRRPNRSGNSTAGA